MKFTRFCLISMLLVLNACTETVPNLNSGRVITSTPEQLEKSKTFVYECPDNYSFVSNIEGQMAWLFLADKTISLPRIPSASGEKYSNGQSTFWNKGEQARLELGSKVYKNCINNPRKAIWEHAKLNGIDYRAVGNEPGWVLEISEEYTLIFSYQYGNKTLDFSTSERTVDQQAHKTIYLAQENGYILSMTILGVTCQDTMSDESYESTVTVDLDGKVFKGCGKALH